MTRSCSADGMGAKARAAALARLDPRSDGPPLLAVATGPYVGEGVDCPALDTLFLAAPVAFKGRLAQLPGRILRAFPGKATAEVHDHHDVGTGVLASSPAERAPGYTASALPIHGASLVSVASPPSDTESNPRLDGHSGVTTEARTT
jgi:hypothetical protein